MKAQITNIIHSQLVNAPLQGLTTSSLIDSDVERKLSFNETTQKWEPYDAPLIRLQFDVEDLLQVRNPRPMNVDALRAVLALHLVRSGIRDVEHPTATTPNSAVELGNPHPYQKVSENELLAYS